MPAAVVWLYHIFSLYESYSCILVAFSMIIFNLMGVLLMIIFNLMGVLAVFRSSPPEEFLGKDVLKICRKFTGEHPWRSVTSTKLQSNLLKECDSYKLKWWGWHPNFSLTQKTTNFGYIKIHAFKVQNRSYKSFSCTFELFSNLLHHIPKKFE